MGVSTFYTDFFEYVKSDAMSVSYVSENTTVCSMYMGSMIDMSSSAMRVASSMSVFCSLVMSSLSIEWIS